MVERTHLFPVIEVEGREFEFFEQLGTKAKFWYDSRRHLFKRGRAGTGENWAEVVAAEIAAGLGLPHAAYAFAVTHVLGEDWQGVSTPNFVPKGARLVLGNELIMRVSTTEKAIRQAARRQNHTLSKLYAWLGLGVQTPLEWNAPQEAATARATMSGYLMLDALISNQDRHEENWGLVVVTPDVVHLAPTFDHASSLGRNETDRRRLSRLKAVHPAHSMEGYAQKAQSQLYDRHGNRLKTIEAFHEYCKYERQSCAYWLTKLQALDHHYFTAILRRVPEGWISDPARDFAVELLMVNRRRLLELVL